MKRIAALITLASLVVGLSLVTVSCMGKPPTPYDMNALIRLGKHYLTLSKEARAYNYFKEAYQLDANHDDAIWGVALSDAGRVIRNLDGLVKILSGVYIYQPSVEECAEACDQLNACGLTELANATPETCMAVCPFGLQPDMFDAITESDSCQEIRKKALEWVIALTPADCELLCNDLALCGNINPPLTWNLDECKQHCPEMYVERHGMCYLGHLGECNRYDRTCFEHTIVGFQYLFEEFGAKLPPEVLEYSDILLTRPDVQFYVKTHAWHFTKPALTLTLDGRYGEEELHFIRAVGHFFQGFIDLLTSVNLDVNTVTFDIVQRRFPADQPDGSRSITTWLKLLSTALNNMVHDPIFPGAGIVKDDAWAIPQITDGGRELGFMFDEFARFLYTMMADTDRQNGKALGYMDSNNNFQWDPEETLTFRDLTLFGRELSMNRYQADAVAAFSTALANNLLYRTPFKLDALEPVFEAYGLEAVNFIIDVIAKNFTENGEIDPSRLFYEPKPTGFYDLVQKLVNLMVELLTILGDSAA